MRRTIVLMLLLSVVGFGQEKQKEIQNSPAVNDPDLISTGATQEYWICSTCKGMFIKNHLAIICSNYHPKGCCHHWDTPSPLQMTGTGEVEGYDPIDISLSTELIYLMPYLSLTESQSGTSTIVIREGDNICLSYSESILLAELKDGQLEITKRSACIPSMTSSINCWPTPCDFTIHKVWKEIYTARDGKIVLSKTIEGKIVPAQSERIEWPKE